MGIVHWRDSGLRAFDFQIFLTCNLINKSYEIANETIPEPLHVIAQKKKSKRNLNRIET